jgi:cell division protein FtsW (lipid II flippase)
MKVKQPRYSRKTERILLGAVTLLIALMALRYYTNIKTNLKEATAGYQQEKVINLSSPVNTPVLQKIVTKGGYFTDDVYARFVAQTLTKAVERAQRLPNLGVLNKKDMMIPATDFLESGSDAGYLRFLNGLAHLGMDSALYQQELKSPVAYSSKVPLQEAETGISIRGTVNLESSAEQGPKTGTLIRLTEVLPQSFYDSLREGEQTLQTEFYARTDPEGHYAFTHLKPGSNYSIQPIRPGFEFGTPKGVIQVDKSKTLDFNGQVHKLRILDRVEYRQIKNDRIFTIRTPDDFIRDFTYSLIFFVAGFWLFHLALSIRNYRSDPFILPLVMFISGTGVMVLFGIQDPLRDEIYGSGMAQYAAWVLVVGAVLAFIFKNNPVNRFYHSKWFDPLHYILPWTNRLKAPRGYTWLILSIVIMLMLTAFGTGPEGSGVRVNLFGFQVSELSKYLMIVFFGVYFTVNAGYFRNIPNNRWLVQNNLSMLILFLVLLGIYAMLGDLGPAIVLCLTFLFFYSFAKNEFFQMVLAAVIFTVLLFITSRYVNSPGRNYLPLLAGLACVGTLLYALIKKKHESVFLIILIISSFILLAGLPFEFTQRLADRNGMFTNIWENKLSGGDQIAHGVWSLNAGGFLGQGLGKGFSNVMPAHHTDMIVESIGEELGLLALATLFIAFGLLVYRCVLSARRTGKPFMFYLMAGIAIATMLQFALIVAGTLGLIPLTGVSVPFLSKGNAGIILTMLAFVMVIIMSNEKGDVLEMKYVREHFDDVNTYAILSFFGIVLVFTGALLWYQFHADRYVVKPALVLNRKGEWQYSYNPRIGLMLRDIKPGNIYDGNGVLLATSDKQTFDRFRSRLIPLGADAEMYSKQTGRDQKRYYPFSRDMIFWLGDYNTEIAREENNGYAAEFRHYTMLRGFEVPFTVLQKTSDRYKEARFLPETEKESELVRYDYSALAPLIRAGNESRLKDSQNLKPKDLQLSVDAIFSQKINHIIQTKDPFKNYRISVVALNAKSGEVLASCMNPQPSPRDLKLIGNIEPLDYNEIFKRLFQDRIVVPRDLGITFNSRPGSTIKIVDAYAAMNQYGTKAANFSFFISPGEVIRHGEPVNETVDMHKAIVRSSNVYFIKLANEKNLQASLFNMYDLLGMNILNRGGFHFRRPERYNQDYFLKEWNNFVKVGKKIYYNKRLAGSKRRFASRYSDLAWGQGELMATPLQLAKMSGIVSNNGLLQPSVFLKKSWNQPVATNEEAIRAAGNPGMNSLLASFMKEQSASVAAATGLAMSGKTGSPERDKVTRVGNKTVLKRVTDAWYTFYVPSPKLKAPVAFTIRIEEIGNSDFAKQLAREILMQLKASGYF